MDDYADYFVLPSTFAYATSCRDITNKMSQDNIALSAATISKELKKISKSESASIVLWEITDDGLQAHRFSVAKWHSIVCGGWRINIVEPLLILMQIKRSEKQPNETGGVLIGQYDFFRKIIYVSDMVFSPDDSIATPTSYIRGCAGLPEIIHRISQLTNGNFSYIGEWHSHPGCDTGMSNLDRQLIDTIGIICESQCLLGFMVICGAGGNYSVHIRENTEILSASFCIDSF